MIITFNSRGDGSFAHCSQQNHKNFRHSNHESPNSSSMCQQYMIRVVFFPHRQLNISVAAAAGAVSFISFVVFDTQVKLCLTQQLCEIACHQV